MTDQHYDWAYKPGSNPVRGVCREGKGLAGLYGDYNCDVPWSVIESAIKKMKEIDPNPDFILNSGDSYPHAGGTIDDVAETVKNTTEILRKYFPDTPIIYSPGNHDFYPCHCCPAGPNFWLAVLSDQIKPLLNEEQRATFAQGGYYSTVVGDLRIVSLNTVLYYSQNKDTANGEGDLSEQYAFVKSELDKAKKYNQKVLIVGHVPPGFDCDGGGHQFHPQFNVPYLQAFDTHPEKSRIIGQIYGHTHHDSYRLSNGSGVLFVAPSVDPWLNFWAQNQTANNPAMARRFFYDQDNLNLLKYEQYWMDLTLANLNDKIDWQLEYQSDKAPFYLPDLSLKSFINLTYKLENDLVLFDNYYNLHYVQYPQIQCNSLCKKQQICGLKYLYDSDYEKCRKN
ncbi:sphingomyelin phosphodiesterase [Anaeramoeba flamelloides]|uniref:Sphingomyelin phosphodiesterase n=1 Tax=Anaeramoeba flamelloides TaxID=1746091 RepID=A0ABQ8YG04_9EUKA|nr:sphingomyelin phosphodiesterase [Anaeramoeba flamelloides]